MHGHGLLLLFAIFKENLRVYDEIVWPPTESCADWDFTSITNNTPSPMNYFLCHCTCHSSILPYCCTCESVNENLVVLLVVMVHSSGPHSSDSNRHVLNSVNLGRGIIDTSQGVCTTDITETGTTSLKLKVDQLDPLVLNTVTHKTCTQCYLMIL